MAADHGPPIYEQADVVTLHLPWMELEATQEVIRFFNAEPLHSVVPESEYVLMESSC